MRQFWAASLCTCVAMVGACALVPEGVTGAVTLAHPVVGVVGTPDGRGYWEVASDGGVFALGDAPFEGSMGGHALGAPVVGMSGTPDGNGYREVASDGGIFAFGDAGFEGSMGGHQLDAPVVGMAATPDGLGYWEVASDGGIFAFGNAAFEGSMGGRHLNAPVVGMAATPDGKGYWEVASDGGIFAFGDAAFNGSMGGQSLKAPVVGIVASPAGKGYWEVASDGGVFAFGGAPFEGSEGGQHLMAPIASMAVTPHGTGYWEVASDGGSFAFGDAVPIGSPPSVPPRIAFLWRLVGHGGSPGFHQRRAGGGRHSLRANVRLRPVRLASGDAGRCRLLPTDRGGPRIRRRQLHAVHVRIRARLAAVLHEVSSRHAIGDQRVARRRCGGLPGRHPLRQQHQFEPQRRQPEPDLRLVGSREHWRQLRRRRQAVMLNGAFTWTLPCLPGEPCTGPSGSNVVRGPDGSHFCPSGSDTIVGYYAECTVYSSGAFRFAAAMLKPVIAGG